LDTEVTSLLTEGSFSGQISSDLAAAAAELA
jgi:hypothetical protein